MRAALLIALAAAGTELSAQRAASPAEATVFIRLVGSAHVEIEEQGNRRVADLEQAEIGTGTGFIVSSSGYVLTNHHVVEGGTTVETRDNAKVTVTTRVSRIDVCLSPEAARAQGSVTPCAEASVFGSDPDRDLAVLFVSAPSLPYLALGDSDAVSRGQPVQALGFPFGRQVEVGRAAVAPGLVPEISIAEGTIAALREGDAGQPRYLQVTSNLNPGNSGGPLVDDAGFVVGVVSMKIRGSSGIGFAIPVNDAKDFLEMRGLDQLLPTRRLRLGPFESVPEKSLGLRLPVGLQDVTRAQSRVETDAGASDVVLRVDRVFTPWTPRQVEQSLVTTQQFERFTAAGNRSLTVTPAGGTPRQLGRATGTAVDSDQPLRVEYAVLDLGPEVLVARYVGSEEALAFNASILRASLESVEGQGLLASALPSLPSLTWAALPMGDTRGTLP
ncbi:MAG TPA: trypsin-like peptidase domain-containing protein, partial [Vicinamibacterales bacterium]